MKNRILMLLLPAVLLAGCQSPGPHPLFTTSEAKPVTNYSSFDEYLQKTEAMVIGNRHFLTDDQEEELKANLPFEIRPANTTTPQKGVLLVHGLGDSPLSFVDVGQELAEKGFLVRTALLPGHGTRPGDMINADHKDWQSLVARQVELLKNDVEDVYLGGFSTGGNLVYLHANEDPEIKGLMLFSPGFQSNDSRIRYTSLISGIKPWLRDFSPDREDNYARYMTVPTNGFAQYYRTSKKTIDSLEEKTFDRPVFMVLTEHDSVLDTETIRTLFNERFTHSDSRLMWFGFQPSGVSGRVINVDSRIPEMQVSNMSHMGMLFSPDNSFYGINGSQRICHNGHIPENREHCQAGKPVWYSAWGYQEEGKVHARLTFNPVFDQMIDDLSEVFDL